MFIIVHLVPGAAVMSIPAADLRETRSGSSGSSGTKTKSATTKSKSTTHESGKR